MNITINRDNNSINKKITLNMNKKIKELSLDLKREIQLNAPVDTGALKNSWKIENLGEGALIGSELEYAKPVEFGTFKSSPKPYVRPSIKKIKVHKKR